MADHRRYEMSFTDRLQANAKAIAGALAGAVISVLQTTVTDPEGSVANVELPNTEEEWVAFVIAVIIGFALPWLKENFPSVPEAQRKVTQAEQRVAEGKQSA
jgi:fructose-specific phosphotransferase system IIC component